MKRTFTKPEISLCIDALTVFIRSGEFKQEQSDEIEALYGKLCWLYTHQKSLDLPANDGEGELIRLTEALVDYFDNDFIRIQFLAGRTDLQKMLQDTESALERVRQGSAPAIPTSEKNEYSA